MRCDVHVLIWQLQRLEVVACMSTWKLIDRRYLHDSLDHSTAMKKNDCEGLHCDFISVNSTFQSWQFVSVDLLSRLFVGLALLRRKPTRFVPKFLHCFVGWRPPAIHGDQIEYSLRFIPQCVLISFPKGIDPSWQTCSFRIGIFVPDGDEFVLIGQWGPKKADGGPRGPVGILWQGSHYDCLPKEQVRKVL